MKNKFIYSILALVFILQSCKEEIDLNVPGGKQKVVIESEVTTETDSSFVKVTRTADYYSTNTNLAVTNAVVTVNGLTFSHTANGIYKPAAPFAAVAGTTYNLNVIADGATYTATSLLEPMFRVDSVFQVFKPKEGFLDAGYAINYIGFDDRPKIKYTYFRMGYFDTIVERDSMDNNLILFNSDQTPIGTPYFFELPFTRFQPQEEVILIFRSVTKEMNDFIAAYNEQTSGAPGPFQVPPANLPTNIKGGAIGYFATYDIIRRRYTVK
ncbi:MAG: DUF4249 family protein [Bacteroidota bacterium]